VRALICLATLYGKETTPWSPLFLRVHPLGAVLIGQPVVCTNFALQCNVLIAMLKTTSILSRSLSQDLQDLGYKSWSLYGTHSFRGGGCQHRIKDNKWTIDMVAGWGGWSQIEAQTMFRYFYSPNDNHEYMANYDCNVGKRHCSY
jgi:hypothetical protein